MRTLKLEEIAPYYPYDLKVMCKGKQDRLCGIMFSDDTDYETAEETYHNINHPLANLETHTVDLKDVKPILRPLKDFTHFKNEIGGYLQSEIYNAVGFEIDSDFEINIGEIVEDTNYLSIVKCHEALQFLFQHHFDVFGLINAGLAIDINSIKP